MTPDPQTPRQPPATAENLTLIAPPEPDEATIAALHRTAASILVAAGIAASAVIALLALGALGGWIWL